MFLKAAAATTSLLLLPPLLGLASLGSCLVKKKDNSVFVLCAPLVIRGISFKKKKKYIRHKI